jgi:hypothetical protein
MTYEAQVFRKVTLKEVELIKMCNAEMKKK